MNKKLLCLAVALILTALLLIGCGSSGDELEYLKVEVLLDENGEAYWEAVPEADGGYRYVFLDENGETDFQPSEYYFTEVPRGVPIRNGWRLRVWPVAADGTLLGVFESGTLYQSTDPGTDPAPGVEPGPGVEPEPDPGTVGIEILVDENGFATWNSIEGTARYDLQYFYMQDANMPTALSENAIVENGGVQLSDGYGLIVSAFDERDELITAAMSEIYGDPAKRDAFGLDVGYVNAALTTKNRDLLVYDVMDAIRFDTVVTAEDGSVTFEADAPKGGTMRFYGHGIRVADGTITMMTNGFLTALDAVGRIYYYQATIVGDDQGVGCFRGGGGYTLSDKTSVDSYLDLTYTVGYAEHTANDVIPFDPNVAIDETKRVEILTDTMFHQPNFITVCGSPYYDAFRIEELSIRYLDDAYTTDIELARLYESFTGAYLEGEKYDLWDVENPMRFYLIAVPKLRDRREPIPHDIDSELLHTGNALYTVTSSLYSVEGLQGADGRALDIQTTSLAPGMTLAVRIGNDRLDVPLNVLPRFISADVMHELVPYAYPEATGTIDALVVPIRWQDDPADLQEVYEHFQAALGRVIDAEGNVHDYSDRMTAAGRASLSDYFDVASLGKLNVRSFMTDWYEVPYTFAEMRERAPDQVFTDALLAWLYERYPDLSRFDKDANGYIDSLILLNAGEVGDFYNIISFSGGILTRNTYTGEYAGTPERPTVNCYINANIHLIDHNVLIHEFGHNLGLIDYYDVTHSGIDAVGFFDMQSASVGDWNSYSKYAAGWIEPEIVTGLDKGESVEITIGAAARTGDAIVIPGAESGHDGTPFGEYVLIDLFTDDGNNRYDAASYGLANVAGVRIYHVNANMEARELTVEGSDERYPIGTPHIANDHKTSGKYHIELIQAGGDNTFTRLDNLRTQLMAEDLFRAGSSFTVEAYDEFFGDGRMDDGTAFGYRIDVVGITAGDEPEATIRITRQ